MHRALPIWMWIFHRYYIYPFLLLCLNLIANKNFQQFFTLLLLIFFKRTSLVNKLRDAFYKVGVYELPFWKQEIIWLFYISSECLFWISNIKNFHSSIIHTLSHIKVYNLHAGVDCIKYYLYEREYFIDIIFIGSASNHKLNSAARIAHSLQLRDTRKQ